MSRAAWLIVALALMPSMVGGIGVQTNDLVHAGEPARQALERGDYEEAVRQARLLLATVVSQSGPDSLEAARVSDLLVEALLQDGEAADPSTLDVAQRTVAIKRMHTTERLETAASLVNLGRVQVERGAFAAALTLHQEAVSIRSQALAPDDPLVADSLDALAHTLIQMDRFDDARPLLVKSLGIREPRSYSDPHALARTLELQAWLFRYAGDYDQAQAPLERALAIRQRLPPDHPDRASVIQVQGDVLWLRGDIQQAGAKWSEGLALVERALRFEHPAMVGFQRRLALSANVLGYRSESRQLLDSGLQIGERGLAPCNRELTGLRQYLASFLEYDGEYAQARKAYQQELQIIEKCFGPAHSFAATVIYNQAILAADTGDFAEAERLHDRAIRIWTAGLGANHPYVARGLDALAEVVAARGQPSRARTLYERALAIRRRSAGDDNPSVAWTLTNLARVSADSGNRTLAERSVTQAIDIYQRIGAADEPDHLSRALVLRGELEARRGDYNAARASFAEALSGREQIFGPTHPLTAETRTKLAAADLALNFTDAALDGALAAEQAGRDHLRFTIRYLPERQAMAYAARRPRGLDLALSIVAGGHADDAAAVFDAVIRSRGVILDELAARAQSAAAPGTAVASLNKAMAAARERFANLMMRSIQDGFRAGAAARRGAAAEGGRRTRGGRTKRRGATGTGPLECRARRRPPRIAAAIRARLVRSIRSDRDDEPQPGNRLAFENDRLVCRPHHPFGLRCCRCRHAGAGRNARATRDRVARRSERTLDDRRASFPAGAGVPKRWFSAAPQDLGSDRGPRSRRLTRIHRARWRVEPGELQRAAGRDHALSGRGRGAHPLPLDGTRPCAACRCAGRSWSSGRRRRGLRRAIAARAFTGAASRHYARGRLHRIWLPAICAAAADRRRGTRRGADVVRGRQ